MCIYTGAELYSARAVVIVRVAVEIARTLYRGVSNARIVNRLCM